MGKAFFPLLTEVRVLSHPVTTDSTSRTSLYLRPPTGQGTDVNHSVMDSPDIITTSEGFSVRKLLFS
jgi:hypothetical protein